MRHSCKVDFVLFIAILFRLTQKKCRTPLMLAAMKSNVEMTLMLLRAGAYVTMDSQDVQGNTALHYAALLADSEYAQVSW